MLGQPNLALQDPFHNLAHGHALAFHSIAIGPLLKRFLHRYFTRAATIGYGESSFHHDVENGALRGAGSGWAAPGAPRPLRNQPGVDLAPQPALSFTRC